MVLAAWFTSGATLWSRHECELSQFDFRPDLTSGCKTTNNPLTISFVQVWVWLLFYILATSTVISRRIPTCDSTHSWWLYSTTSGHQHHNLLSHSVILSWHWANQCPNNAEHQDRERQVSILKSLIWLNQVSNPQSPDSNLWSSDSPISHKGRRALYSFALPDLFPIPLRG